MKIRFSFLIVALAALLLSAFAAPAGAQTAVSGPPFLPTDKVAYDMASTASATGVVITDASQAITFAARLKDPGFIATYIEYPTVTCTGSQANPPVTCQATLGQAAADALNKVGGHQATITLFRQDIGEVAASDPFVFPAKPAAATKVRILRTP